MYTLTPKEFESFLLELNKIISDCNGATSFNERAGPRYRFECVHAIHRLCSQALEQTDKQNK